MFNLSEQWTAEYEQFLNEQFENVNSDISVLFTELEESQNAVLESFSLLEEYMNLSEVTGVKPEKEQENEDDKRAKSGQDILMNLIGKNVELDSTNFPMTLSSTYVEKVADMKFPRNIIYFIKHLGLWLVKVAVYFIEKLKNILRAVIGAPQKELKPEALKHAFEESKKLETIATIAGKTGDAAVARKVSPKDIHLYTPLEGNHSLSEGIIDTLSSSLGITKKDDINIRKEPIVISIDVSSDLLKLQELAAHFFELYDNAFGSNNEHLFETEDLELILKLFKDSINNIKTGSTPVYDLGGRATEVSMIDASRVHQNAIKTQANVQSLMSAFESTQAKINQISDIINHKKILLASSMGASYKTLSSSTIKQMSEILKILKPQMADAKKSESHLQKMQNKYKKVSDELQKMQQSLSAVSGITYSTVYQRKVADLFVASKYMTQTISLRLAALGSYIRELKEIKNVLYLLSQTLKLK